MKIIRKTALLLVLGSLIITQSGCFGTFSLTRKTYEYHDGISNSKFVKSLLFWFPGGFVYGIVGLIDVVILNLIEFWSGSNPLSMNEGDYEMQLATIDGLDFKIEATKDTFTTTQLSGDNNGEVRVMLFDRNDLTWKYSDSKVCEQPVLGFLDAQGNDVRVYTNMGSFDMAASDLTNRDVLKTKFEGCQNEAMAAAN